MKREKTEQEKTHNNAVNLFNRLAAKAGELNILMSKLSSPCGEDFESMIFLMREYSNVRRRMCKLESEIKNLEAVHG